VFDGEMDNRKEKERELHDHLRGPLKDSPSFISNKKFYSISKANREYVEKWLIERCKGKRVLDYCCGNGDFSLWIADTGAYVYGIDISPVSIQNASNKAIQRRLADRIKFQVMDAEAMEYEDNFFDLIVVNGVLHHLDLRKAYTELARIIKPEGMIITTEALRHNIFIHSYRKLTPHLRTTWEVKHILGKKEVELAKNYFEKVEINKFFHLATIASVPFRNTSFFEPLRRILLAIDEILLRFPILKWQAWMVVFTLSHPKKQIAKP
jgi:ubiquinone/menaquinone biosynthesis C-methylase UbiE